jgi:Ku70/Ku80 beta-barrel domain
MAPRAYWKGYLKLSLVSCPIQLFPGTSEREKIKFHQVNRRTGNRIKYCKIDAVRGGLRRARDPRRRGYFPSDGPSVCSFASDRETRAEDSACGQQLAPGYARMSHGPFSLNLVPLAPAGNSSMRHASARVMLRDQPG